MGKIKQGILGGFSGKVGAVVGSSWKGIAVMKAKPLSVANPRTSAQVNQRSKFAAIILVAVQLLATVIKPLWDRFSLQKSGYNAFISENMKIFGIDGTPDYSKMIISKGKMPATPFFAQEYHPVEQITDVEWDPAETNQYSAPTDLAYCVVLGVFADRVETFVKTAPRANGIMNIEGNLSGATEMHAYLCFRRLDGTVVSNTAYTVVTE